MRGSDSKKKRYNLAWTTEIFSSKDGNLPNPSQFPQRILLQCCQEPATVAPLADVADMLIAGYVPLLGGSRPLAGRGMLGGMVGMCVWRGLEIKS